MLYLIRHGQTDWNKVHKLQGASDVPLNDVGREMARSARKDFSALEIDICFSSPLMRAKETADILLEGRNIPVEYDDRLKEINFGEFEGRNDYREKPESAIYKMFHDPANYVRVGGTESFEEVFERARSFLQERLSAQHKDGKNVLIVAHGAIIAAIYNEIYNVPLEKFWDNLVRNCEVLSVPDDALDTYFSM